MGRTLTAIIRDTSSRKSSEQELKEYAESLEQKVDSCARDHTHLEEQYQVLVETANDAIISTDKHGKIIYFNRKAEEIYGYEKEEILGKNISVIAPKESWHKAQVELKLNNSPFKNQRGRTFESWGIQKSKTTFPLECTLSVYEGNGEAYFTSIVRDISRRKKLEKQLQEYTTNLEEKVKERTYELTKSQQRLNEKLDELSILNEIGEVLASTMDLESVLDIILVGATSHHGLGFNRAFLFLLNDDATYLEGKVAIGPSNPKEAHKIWSGILGKQLTLKQILLSYTNQQGKVDTHVNNLVKSIGIPMSGDENILIQVVKHKKSYNITDASNHHFVEDDLIKLMNCNAFTLVPLITKDKTLGVLWADNAITKKPIEDRDLERLRTFANNASLAIENSNLYRNLKEKVTELDSAYQELKENKDRLIRSEKLAAVGEMSATVAHGIRNPLTAIGGFARRLLKKGGDEHFSNKYLKIIIDEIDRLENLLTEILDFVRPKKLHLRSVCIQDLLESTLQIFKFELEKGNIAVTSNLRPNLPMVNIDTDQLKRVFLNIINNSIEAMPDGGKLTITTLVENCWVKIIFADTGMGIDDQDIEKIFHPFFTRKSTGSGLGLAVCNQIVCIHGGHIKLKKQAPSGAIFEIYLPVHRPDTPVQD
jgi:PAS domain S-box-containing protein